MANTGRLEKEQKDLNPSSPTFNQVRWVDAGIDFAACPLPQSFSSDALEEYVTKNDCGPGLFGSSVRVFMAAGTYTSTESKNAANDEAIAAFNTTKQSFANQNGTCANSPDSTVIWNPNFFSSGCFACTMTNQEDPSDVRAANNEEVAQYSRSTGANGTPCEPCQLQ